MDESFRPSHRDDSRNFQSAEKELQVVCSTRRLPPMTPTRKLWQGSILLPCFATESMMLSFLWQPLSNTAYYTLDYRDDCTSFWSSVCDSLHLISFPRIWASGLHSCTLLFVCSLFFFFFLHAHIFFVCGVVWGLASALTLPSATGPVAWLLFFFFFSFGCWKCCFLVFPSFLPLCLGNLCAVSVTLCHEA